MLKLIVARTSLVNYALMGFPREQKKNITEKQILNQANMFEKMSGKGDQSKRVKLFQFVETRLDEENYNNLKY